MIVLEIKDRHGRTEERHRLTRLPATVGRAYDNDVIVDDPFVSPHHLRIEATPQGGIAAIDLDSTNGLVRLKARRRRVQRMDLLPSARFRIGRTNIRACAPDFPVADAEVDRAIVAGLGERVDRAGTFLFVVLLGILAAYGHSAIVQYGGRDPGELIMHSLISWGIFILLWTGVWSLVSRVNTHRFHFFAHGVLACTGFLLLSAEDMVMNVLRFAISADAAMNGLDYLGGLAIISLVLYFHLRFSTNRSPRKLAMAGVLVAALFVGLIALNDHVGRDKFSGDPDYHPSLYPEGFAVSRGVAPASVATQAAKLRVRVDELVAEAEKNGR